MRRFLIFGHYGYENVGDDAMLYALLQELNGIHPQAEFTVVSRVPVTIPFSTKDKVRFVRMNPVSILRELMRSPVFIVGGGSHINDYGRFIVRAKVLLTFSILLAVARVFSNKVYLIGNGIGPIQTIWGRILGKTVCRLANYITVRDKASYEIVEEFGLAKKVTLAFDLAVLISPEYQNTGSDFSRSTQRILGISVTPVFEIYHNMKGKDSRLIDAIADAINQELDKNEYLEVWVFIFKGGPYNSGYAISDMLQNHLRPSERVKLVPYNPNPRQILSKISQCHAFVGMHYHSCLFAYISNVPLLVIDYHPKCRELAHEVGLPEHAVMSLDEILGGSFGERLKNLLESPKDSLATLPQALAMDRSRLATNILKETVS